ncbi:unnamed protein product [Larinioides sclopetarius]|uniref:Uncharacterized protein n=1 Tax=Larinioides sclopetarius TaxID=280406 RepID=A0AAV2BYM7_9ARAC
MHAKYVIKFFLSVVI